jgi:hypothetical protein
MFLLSFRYSLFVFVAVVGILQAASSYNNLQGLSFFKKKLTGYLFALVTTGSALTAFFTWNYWLATGIIEGSQQFGLFILSALVALIFTLALSSAIKHSNFNLVISPTEGIESLKNTTIFRIWRKKARKESHV